VTAPRTERLRSYGGDVTEARVHRPGTLEELRAVLRVASHQRTRLTFRGAGLALDTQSLNTEVVSLAALTEIRVDVDAGTVTAGPGATWGAILAATLRHRMVPYVMVTTRHATAAGTASADSISRFSPSCGKEGWHVLSVRLLTIAGDELHCSRTHHRDVFFGVIGGLGYLGAIVAVEYRLWKLGYVPAVESRVTPCASLAELVPALVPRDHGEQARRLRDGLAPAPEGIEAISAVCFQRRALVIRSRYLDTSRRRPLRLLHQPDRLLRRLFDMVLRVPLINALGWWLTFRVLFRREQTYIDGLEDFTFFMDGNVRAKELGLRLGLAMRVLQQTFIVPAAAAPSPAGDTAARPGAPSPVAGFLDEASTELDRRRLVPTMLDVMFAPQDEGFLLSPSDRLDGYAVSFAFDTSNEATRARAREFLIWATKRCRAIGGRLSLVKNVCADAADIAAMYGDHLDRFLALTQRLDPHGLLHNEFFDRVLAARMPLASSPGRRDAGPAVSLGA
jgi:FAD/FMN-containing dehydrogenase